MPDADSSQESMMGESNTAARQGEEEPGKDDLSVITLRMTKQEHAALWQVKIIRGIPIEKCVRDALRSHIAKLL